MKLHISIYPYALVLIAGCSSSHNDLMTKLINERKDFTDSLTIYKETMQHLQDEGGKMDIHGADSVLWKRMLDTARMANDGISVAEKRIPELTFSIDSLSKMK